MSAPVPSRRDQIVAEFERRRQGGTGKAHFLDADELPADFADLRFGDSDGEMLLTEFVKGKLPFEDKQMHICEFVLSISYEKFDKLEGRLRLAAYDRMDRDMSSAESYDIIVTSCLLFLRTICARPCHIWCSSLHKCKCSPIRNFASSGCFSRHSCHQNANLPR